MLLFRNIFKPLSTFNSYKLLSSTSSVCDNYNFEQHATLKTKTVTDDSINKTLPIKPKKPLTTYFRFMKDIRPILYANDPKIRASDIVKISAAKWLVIDEQKKKKYDEEYKKDQVIYLQKLKQYESKLTDEHRIQIRQATQDRLAAKTKRLLRKKNRELGKPKKPAMSFVLFLKELRTKLPQNPNESYKEWHKRVTVKWIELNEDQKKRYADAFKIELEKYKIDLLKWEEKMISLGHTDVVRNRSLIKPETKSRKSLSKTKSKNE